MDTVRGALRTLRTLGKTTDLRRALKARFFTHARDRGFVIDKRLQPRRGTSSRSWFRQDSTLVQRLFGRPPLRDPATVVDEAMTLFPELERYWTSGEVGPHVRLWALNEPRPREKEES